MAAVAGPTVLRLRPRAASLSAPAVSASPRCRLSSVAYSYPKLAGSFAVQRVKGSRMQYVDTLKEQVLRNSATMMDILSELFPALLVTNRSPLLHLPRTRRS
ncbi:hypothetical protein D1007_02432 [Hordeum vulgare]|nr:hypothetical protein D1007_02432 [Hordeum vulgare]